MGKLNKIPFITDAEIEEILSKPFPDPLENLTEEDINKIVEDFGILLDNRIIKEALEEDNKKENSKEGGAKIW